jgi:enterochelin esterase-like enzyme
MRHLLLLHLFVLASLAPAQDRREQPRRPPAELRHVTFREERFAAAAVDQEMPFGIYLPRDYEAEANRERRYPLVIWLHGMWEDHLRFHERGGAMVLDQALGEGLLPPCIFVLANGGRTSMYIDAGKGRNWQQLVQHDLLARVTKSYRVDERRDARALMGISMGGMAALRIGFLHPELFGTVAVHSAAVFPADPAQLSPQLLQRAARFGLDEVFGNPIDAELWAKTNPLGIAAGLEPAGLRGLRLWFDAGTEDTRFGFGKSNTALHEVLDERKVPHAWTLVQGGGHAWGSGFQEASLLASLKFVGTGFTGAAKADGKGQPAPAAATGR